MTELSKIDPNFKSVSPVSADGFFNIDNAPFTVYGVGKDEKGYYRLPPAVAEKVSENVAMLTRNTAGGLIRFRTNSPTLALRTSALNSGGVMPHMTALGSAGFDVYCGMHFAASFPPPLPVENGYTMEKTLYLDECTPDSEGFYDLTVYMPLYGSYRDISLKVGDGYEFRPMRECDGFRNKKPVLFYGSSITQGGCTSTPGSLYSNQLSRTLNLYCVNYGFSGSAKGETALAEHIARMELSAFVMDYDHNAPSAAHLSETHRRFFRIIREAQPLLPIVLASSIPVFIPGRGMTKRAEIIRNTYEEAVRGGDKNVYFLNGHDFFDTIPFDHCTVDGIHPNSLGMYLMAKGFERVLKTLNL